MNRFDPSRRAVLAGAAAFAVSAAAPALAADDPISGMIVINGLSSLADPAAEPLPGETPPANIVENRPHFFTARSVGDAKAAGLAAAVMTIGHVSGPADPFEHTVADIGRFDRIVRNHPNGLLKVLSAADIRRAKAEGKVGVIYATQNSLMLGDKAERVQVFADLGIRQFQLTYNTANTVGDGSMAPENRGLTPFGREVVAQANAARLLIDLSHSGEKTCLDAIAASKGPIIVSHTGCRAIAESPRNKSDAELRAMAQKGGYVGIYFMPFLAPNGHATASDVVAHIEHAIDVCGEDVVGIGTDGTVTGIDDLDAYRLTLADHVAHRQAAGVGAAGERADTLPFVPDLHGVDQFHRLIGLLEQRGHSWARIEKVLGRNFVAYAERIWG